jgi:hypothetical protein
MAKRKVAKRKAPKKKNFLSRLQKTVKIRSIKAKIKKQKAAAKKLSMEYKRALKSEAKKLK